MELNEFIRTHAMLTAAQETFFRAYIEAVYFTDTGGSEQPPHYAELSVHFLREAAQDCRKFYNVYSQVFGRHNIEQAGRDFWLTRNGHGTGFWDHPDIYGESAAQELTRACEFAGEQYSDFSAV